MDKKEEMKLRQMADQMLRFGVGDEAIIDPRHIEWVVSVAKHYFKKGKESTKKRDL